MDIQVSSNFERLLFELSDRKPGRVRKLMDDLKNRGSFELSTRERSTFAATFSAATATEDDTRGAIARRHRQSGRLVDPHTAVAVAVQGALDPPPPVVILATAHPAKFPEAIEAATGAPPPEPEAFARQKALPERVTVLANDASEVARFMQSRSRAAHRGAA